MLWRNDHERDLQQEGNTWTSKVLENGEQSRVEKICWKIKAKQTTWCLQETLFSGCSVWTTIWDFMCQKALLLQNSPRPGSLGSPEVIPGCIGRPELQLDLSEGKSIGVLVRQQSLICPTVLWEQVLIPFCTVGMASVNSVCQSLPWHFLLGILAWEKWFGRGSHFML